MNYVSIKINGFFFSICSDKKNLFYSLFAFLEVFLLPLGRSYQIVCEIGAEGRSCSPLRPQIHDGLTQILSHSLLSLNVYNKKKDKEGVLGTFTDMLGTRLCIF